MGTTCACFQHNNNYPTNKPQSQTRSPRGGGEGKQSDTKEEDDNNLPSTYPQTLNSTSDDGHGHNHNLFRTKKSKSLGSRAFRERRAPYVHQSDNGTITYKNPKLSENMHSNRSNNKNKNDKSPSISPIAPGEINIASDASNRLTSPNNKKGNNKQQQMQGNYVGVMDASTTQTPTTINTTPTQTNTDILRNGSLSTPNVTLRSSSLSTPNVTSRERNITNPSVELNLTRPSSTATPEDNTDTEDTHNYMNKSRDTLILMTSSKENTPATTTTLTPGTTIGSAVVTPATPSTILHKAVQSNGNYQQQHLRSPSLKQYLLNKIGSKSNQRPSNKSDGPLYARANSMGTESTNTRSSMTNTTTTTTGNSMDALMKTFNYNKHDTPKSNDDNSPKSVNAADGVYAHSSQESHDIQQTANKARRTLIDDEEITDDDDDSDGTPGPPPKLELFNNSNRPPLFHEWAQRRISDSNNIFNNSDDNYRIIGLVGNGIGQRQETVGIEQRTTSEFGDSGQYSINIEYDTIYENNISTQQLPPLQSIKSGRHTAESSDNTFTTQITHTATVTPITRSSTDTTNTRNSRNSSKRSFDKLKLPQIMSYVIIYFYCVYTKKQRQNKTMERENRSEHIHSASFLIYFSLQFHLKLIEMDLSLY